MAVDDTAEYEEQPGYEPLCKFDKDYAAYAEQSNAFIVPVINRLVDKGEAAAEDPLPSIPHIVAYVTSTDGPAETVAISGWTLDKQNMGAVLSAMTASNTATLKLSYTSLGSEAFKMLCGHVRQGTLRNLSLDWNNSPDGNDEIKQAQYGALLDSGVTSTDEEISLGSSLQTLSLRGCGIDAQGATAISAMLKINTTLAQLSLFQNKIGDEGIKTLSMSLRQNRTLRVLDISSCGVSDDGVASLLGILRPFKLTHNEVVERRKLISNPRKEDPESPTRASMSKSSKSKTLSLKKKERKPSAKKAATLKNKPKSAKGSRAPSQLDDLETDGTNWLVDATFNEEDKSWSVIGNRMLVALCLSRNPIASRGVEEMVETLEAQISDGAGGLAMVNIEPTAKNQTADKLSAVLATLDPLTKKIA